MAEAQYDVVVNIEEQYSIWRVGQDLPAGWRTDGVRGTRDECLDHIERVWTDMRPLSVRRLDSASGGGTTPLHPPKDAERE